MPRYSAGHCLYVGAEGLEPPKSRGRLVYSEEQLPLCDAPVNPLEDSKKKSLEQLRVVFPFPLHVVQKLLRGT